MRKVSVALALCLFFQSIEQAGAATFGGLTTSFETVSQRFLIRTRRGEADQAIGLSAVFTPQFIDPLDPPHTHITFFMEATNGITGGTHLFQLADITQLQDMIIFNGIGTGLAVNLIYSIRLRILTLTEGSESLSGVISNIGISYLGATSSMTLAERESAFAVEAVGSGAPYAHYGAATVPEPSTWALMVIGLSGLLGFQRRQRS